MRMRIIEEKQERTRLIRVYMSNYGYIGKLKVNKILPNKAKHG